MFQDTVPIPTAGSTQETDFTVTQNLGLLTVKDTVQPVDGNSSPEAPPLWKTNLHELTVYVFLFIQDML